MSLDEHWNLPTSTTADAGVVVDDDDRGITSDGSDVAVTVVGTEIGVVTSDIVVTVVGCELTELIGDVTVEVDLLDEVVTTVTGLGLGLDLVGLGDDAGEELVVRVDRGAFVSKTDVAVS